MCSGWCNNWVYNKLYINVLLVLNTCAAWNSGLYKFFLPLQTAIVVLFSKKNSIIRIFFISECFAVPINPDMWSSAVYSTRITTTMVTLYRNMWIIFEDVYSLGILIPLNYKINVQNLCKYFYVLGIIHT